MPVAHDHPEGLDHAPVGAQRLQRAEQRGHQGDDEEDVEQFGGGREAGAEDGPEPGDEVSGVCPGGEESGGDGGDDDVLAGDHHADDHCHSRQVNPVSGTQFHGTSLSVRHRVPKLRTVAQNVLGRPEANNEETAH
ncbi:hypothetical protein [Nonomuraea ferruginea]|uniref:Uncharacterized protein n=1 Tax=Nonomuraea ferruginea TaxID=46174 RepID=A0ABT4SQN8_9ACTN|nr:hypothetical protein [Nonomuraea ferruginea]MDA0639487.1 hypothetical protein [Nonomuraea ferruginea]